MGSPTSLMPRHGRGTPAPHEVTSTPSRRGAEWGRPVPCSTPVDWAPSRSRSGSAVNRLRPMSSEPRAAIEDYYSEDRTFPPTPEFAADALVHDRSLYEAADA